MFNVQQRNNYQMITDNILTKVTLMSQLTHFWPARTPSLWLADRSMMRQSLHACQNQETTDWLIEWLFDCLIDWLIMSLHDHQNKETEWQIYL